jgi:transcriptional regulator with XRE-family HTH domain
VARPTDSTPEQMAAFGQAIAEELRSRGLTQAQLRRDLEEALGDTIHQTTVSNWVAGKHEPSRTQAILLEEFLRAAPGSLTRHIGYLPLTAHPTIDVIDAIGADPGLTPEQREDLTAQYEGMLARTRARRLQQPRPSER